MWGRIITATFQNWRGKLSATGYLLSQEALIAGLEVAPEEFSYGAYGTYQVPVRRIEGLTGLSLGELPSVDPLETEAAGDEAARLPREVTSPADLIL